MSDVNLSVGFSSEGLPEARRDLSAFADAAQSAQDSVTKTAQDGARTYTEIWKDALNTLESEWLSAKDNRIKILNDIQKAETAALQEEWRQGQRVAAQELSDRKAIEQQKMEAVASAARQELAQMEAIAAEENALAQRNARSYVSWWKDALAEKDALEKQAANELSNANAGGLGPVNQTPVSSNLPSLTDLASTLYILRSIYGVARQIGGVFSDLVEQDAKWEQLDMGLKNMEGSAQGAARAMNDLYQIAKAPGIEMEGAEKAYLKLRAVGLSAVEAKRTLVDFSNTVALSGGGSQQLDRVLEQITQMLANGKVMQQDVRWMEDSMPQLAELMQQAFGTSSVEAIRKMGVSADEFMTKIEAQMELLPKAGQTLRSNVENAETAWSKLKASLVDTYAVKRALGDVTEAMEKLEHIISGNKTAIARDRYQSEATTWAYNRLGYANPNNAAGKIINWIQGADNSKVAELVNVLMADYDQAMKNSGSDFDLGRDDKDLQTQNMRRRSDLKAKTGSKKGHIETDTLVSILENNQKRLDAEQAYQDSLASLESQGIEESIAKVDAETQKKIAALEDEQKKEDEIVAKNRARGIISRKTAANEYATIARQTSEGIAQAQREGGDKIRDIYEKQQKDSVESEILTAKKKLSAEQAYQDSYNRMIAEGADVTVAKIDADTQKKVSELLAWQDSMLAKIDAQSKAHIISAKEAAERKADVQAVTNANITAAGNAEGAQIQEHYASTQPKEENLLNKIEANDVNWTLPHDKTLGQIDMYYDAQQKLIDKAVKADMLGQDKAAKYEDNILRKRRMAQMDFWASTVTTIGSAMEGLTSNLDDLMGNMVGKSSTTYKTLFAISKGFAIADSSVQMMDAIAKAWNGNFPENLVNVAAATSAMGSLIGNINSLAYSGVFDKGGYIPYGSFGIAGENGPEIIQGPATVTSTRDTAALLSGARGSNVNVAVHNYSGSNVEVQKTSSGDIQVIVGKVMASVEKKIAAGIAQGGSPLDQVLSKTYGVRR